MTFSPTRRRSLAGLLILGLSLGASGCREEQTATEVEVKPFAGESVQVAVPAAITLEELWRPILQDWSAATEADARYQPYQGGSTAALPEAQVVFFPLTELPELALSGQLGSLPETFRGADALDWGGLFPGISERVGVFNRQPHALPLSAPVLVCYYRKDLLEKAGRKPPQTWEDYRQLLTDLEQWAPGLVALEPLSEEFRATMIQAHLLATARHPENYSLYFDFQSGEPLLNSPGFVRGLELTQQIAGLLDPESWSLSPGQCRERLLTGKAALVISYETSRGNQQFPFGLDQAGRGESVKRIPDIALGFCPLPGSREVYNYSIGKWETPPGGLNRVTLLGFQGWAAGVKSGLSETQEQAAWDLLQTLTRPENNALPGVASSLIRPGQLERASDFVGEELQSPELAAPGELEDYLQAVQLSLRERQATLELPVIGRERFRRILAEELTRCLQQQTTPAESLRAVDARFKSATKELGPEKVLDSYRLCLGLTRLNR